MTAKYIHELFPTQIKTKVAPENFIEVLNCYDSRYGNIFYKGKLIYNFYKEGYDEAITNYKVVADLQKKGLDIDKALVIVYDLESLRDYQDDMTDINFESAVDCSYKEVLNGFIKDLKNIEDAVKKVQKSYKSFELVSCTPFNQF